MDDQADASHPKVRELRDLVAWSEGMVWSSPERHGAMTGLMKTQIDWIPLSEGAVRPTQGKTLAVMQVSGGSQSFNAVNQMRVLGRWMRMLTIPNQSSIPKAFQEFDADGRMRSSALYDRIVDVMEELVKFTLLTRGRSSYLTDRYSERKETADASLRGLICPQRRDSHQTVMETSLAFQLNSGIREIWNTIAPLMPSPRLATPPGFLSLPC